MRHEIRWSRRFDKDVWRFFRWLKQDASAETAYYYVGELYNDVNVTIANFPKAFDLFHETKAAGKPYRAKVFRLERTSYWIIYEIDEARQTVTLIRLWGTHRKSGTHDL